MGLRLAPIKKAAVIGGGVIGAGWVARLATGGIDVAVHDPAPETQRRVEAVLANAARAAAKLTSAPQPISGAVTFAASIGEAAAGSDLIVEAVPERLDIKQQVYAKAEEAAPDDALIASSTSGIVPTKLQAQLSRPERLLVAHPFNPVYLMPLVEVVGGQSTAPEAIERAMSLFRDLGMHPLHVRIEIDAFIADRLMEAAWREALWLVHDGVATTAEIDDAIRFGFGLRWAQMGMFETYRTAGGEGGLRQFLKQFGPCLQWPWTKLTDVPELTDALIDTIAAQSDAQSGGYTLDELERIRDDNLVGILQALKANDWGAGKTLAEHERRLMNAQAAEADPADLSQPIRTFSRRVPPDWADYNNHMTESRYLECFAQATDALLRMIGVDGDYVASGGSYFTVETHIRHLAEVAAGEPVHATTQVLHAAGKTLRLFHQLFHDGGTLLATGEHMLIHVDLQTRRASAPPVAIGERAAKLAAAHADLPLPDGAGRAIGKLR